MKYETEPGQHIRFVGDKMAELALQNGCEVTAEFNEIQLRVQPGESGAAVEERYSAASKKRHEEWKASPAGVQFQKECDEASERAKRAEAEGILPFDIADQVAWQKCVEINSEPYGACCVRYAARWAHLMEKRMAAGELLANVAKDCGHEADCEGITGFMYGAAVSILARVWKHGDELRRWHNIDTQLGDEGERANESGGVLNPALLTVKG